MAPGWGLRTLFAFVVLWILALALGTTAWAAGVAQVAPAADSSGVLPRSPEETDQAMARIESDLAAVRGRLASSQSLESASNLLEGVTAEEVGERRDLLQQWATALDQKKRYLQNLKEVRQLNRERGTEHEVWHGFEETPTLIVSEQLVDAVSAQRLELRSARMVISIFETDVARYAKALEEDRKQLRLAQESVSNTSRQEWAIRMATLRKEVDEARLETSEMGRQLTWEAITGQEKHLDFLERKLAEARARSRMTKADLDSMLFEIDAKRSALQSELEEALRADRLLQSERDSARKSLHEETKASGVRCEGKGEFRLNTELLQARAETSRQRIEMLRGFLQLTDFVQGMWNDRLWVTQPRTPSQLKAKQRVYDRHLEQLRQWKELMQETLASVSDQMLRHALRAADLRETEAGRKFSEALRGTLQDRANVTVRAVGALAMTEDLALRVQSEITEQAARVSVAHKARLLSNEGREFLRRIWNTELYIAEDTTIAGGQKVTVPRSITLGKVLLAFSIFFGGLFLACSAYRGTNRLSVRFSKRHQSGAEIPAKLVASTLTIVSLLVAMNSVRIPWSVFAFMGGALAIGVGFGAQTLVNNFISGVILLGERTIRVGDIVEVDDQRGKVMRMGFRHSLIARGDGIEVLVPNSQFLEKKLVNWTLTDDLVRYNLSVGVAYSESPAVVSRLMAQAIADHPHVAVRPMPEVLFEDFGAKSLIFTLKFWMKLCPGVDGGRVRSELRHRIDALFKEAGIVMCSPQREVLVDTVRPMEVRLIDATRRGAKESSEVAERVTFATAALG